MKITKKQQSLLDDYDIYGFHSGGGCMHFAYNTEHNEVQWLINPVDLMNDSKGKSYYEPNAIYPSNKDQLCMFGLDFNYINTDDKSFVKDCISQMNKIISTKNVKQFHKDDWCIFYIDTLENGVPKMKKVTGSINKLIKEQD